MESYSFKDFEIIDAHSHIFPKKISLKATKTIGEFYDISMYSEGCSEKLLESGSKIEVSKYLVCSTATIPSQVESINSFIKAECDVHPEFFGFGTLHPDYENLENEVERIISMGMHGIKLHPDFQKFDIDDNNAYRMYEIIEGRLPVLIHMGDNRFNYSRPLRLKKLLNDFPRLQVIAAHFGGYKNWDEADECLRNMPNIKFDTSSTLEFIEPEYARKLIDHFGLENFFFGTDFPMWNHVEELKRFFNLSLSFYQNQQILADNFKEYFNI